MFDLGTSFLASVARDPNALAIVDGTLRLTYKEWYGRISSVVAGFDALGLRSGGGAIARHICDGGQRLRMCGLSTIDGSSSYTKTPPKLLP